MSQSLFYWIYYFYPPKDILYSFILTCLNPYFTGYTTFTRYRRGETFSILYVSILILLDILLLHVELELGNKSLDEMSQSLFYWIYYFYYHLGTYLLQRLKGLNPYFTGYTTFTVIK